MKREILTHRRGDCGCCPGHDTFPDDTYNSRRSKRARARGKQAEHQAARACAKRDLLRLLQD
jgi:hypothetical protein